MKLDRLIDQYDEKQKKMNSEKAKEHTAKASSIIQCLPYSTKSYFRADTPFSSISDKTYAV